MSPHADPYLLILGLVALLFFLPKVLVRLGIPSPVSEMGLGVVCGPLGLGLLADGPELRTAASLGVSALFLFAGMEVSPGELIDRRRTILGHMVLQVGLLAGVAWAVYELLLPDLNISILVAAAIVPSSAAFIIPAVDVLDLPEKLRTWIKQKAITNELITILAVLFFSSQAGTEEMTLRVGGIVALIAIVPLIFMLFHATIARWAPRSEFSFVMIVALFAAYLTEHLGVHFLVGAFVVGVVARRYLIWGQLHGMEMASVHSALESFRFFSSFLMPFFFFQVGIMMPAESFSPDALAFAGTVLLVIVPVRAGIVMLHRRLDLKESLSDSWNVGLLIAPTTVFSVAVAGILRKHYAIDEWIVGALVIYGAATSFLPLLMHKGKGISPEFRELVAQPEMCLVSHLGAQGWSATSTPQPFPAPTHADDLPTPAEVDAATAERPPPGTGAAPSPAGTPGAPPPPQAT